jgi:DNA polymerase V
LIAIVDCNSFYCACERLFRPDLRSRPVVVLSNNDGCIVSRTDEAKRLGVDMGAPYYQSRRTIEKHGVAVFSSNYPLYGDMSQRVMDTLRHIAGQERVEVYSVDEAFLKLDGQGPDTLEPLGREIRETVERWTGIGVSVGIGPSKVLAKVANRLAKKDKTGTRCVLVLRTGGEIQKALQRTAVEDLWGVGRQYALRLRQHGIENGWQLSRMPQEWARKNLGGVVGVRLIRELNGNPCIPLKDPLDMKRVIATTRMFGKPVYERTEIREAVATYTARAAEKLRRQYCAAGLIQVFVVTNDTSQGTYHYDPRSRWQYCTLPLASSDTGELIRHALPLVDRLYTPGPKYLKAGVILGDLVPDAAVQGNLFTHGADERYRSLMEAIDNINFSQRNDSVKYASSGLKRNWKMRQELRSRRYTTRWDELYEIG